MKKLTSLPSTPSFNIHHSLFPVSKTSFIIHIPSFNIHSLITLASFIIHIPLFILLVGFFLFVAPKAAFAANKYWVGADGAATNVASNWKTTDPATCGSGDAGAAPGTADVAIFDADCDNGAAVTGSFSVLGVNINSGYTGTVTQNAVSLTVGASGWTQADGTFTGNSDGSSANITIQSGGDFNLSGGTFTSTNDTLTETDDFTISAGTFTANSGTVKFDAVADGTQTITGSFTAANLTFYQPGCTAAYTDTIASGSTITATGTTTIDGTDSCGGGIGSLNGPGGVNAQGDITVSNSGWKGTAVITVNGTGTQTFTGVTSFPATNFGLIPAMTINKSTGSITLTNTMAISGDFTNSSGTALGGSGTLAFFIAVEGGSQTITGSFTTPNLYIYQPGCSLAYTVTIASGTTVTVTGTTTLDSTDSCGGGVGILNGPGILAAQGAITTSNSGWVGNLSITLSGSANQTVTHNGTNWPTGTVTFNKSAGTIILATTLNLSSSGQDLLVASGSTQTVTGAFSLTVNDQFTVSGTLTQGTTTFVNGATGAFNITKAGTWNNTSTGDMTVGSGGVTNNGTINFGLQNTCGAADTNISITSTSGGSARTWTGNGYFNLYDITVQDQNESPNKRTITAWSSTLTSNSNWVFRSDCPTPPTAFWKFDEGVGTAANDSTSFGSNGTLAGTTIPTWQSEDQCISNKCLYFDGSTSKVTVSNVIKSVKSVALWVRPNTLNATNALIDLDGGTHKITVNSSGAVTATGFSSPTIYVNGISGASLTNNRWNFVEVTTGTAFDTTASLTIATDGTNYTKGFFDEVKIYSYARSANQSASDYNGKGAFTGASQQFGVTPNNQFNALSNGLVGYWKLDESSGNAADSSGNGTTLTNTGTTTYVAGKFANGASLNGTTQYESAADNAPLSVTASLTLSAWINPSSVAAGEADVIAKWNSGGTESYKLARNAAKLRFFLDSSSNYVETSSNQLATSTWYHVAGVYNSSTQTAKIYVNGAEVATTTTGTIPSSIGDDASKIHIGAEQSDSSATNFFAGTIDETRVYNRALSGADIQSLYNFGSGPVGKWEFEEGSGSTANDTSGNSNTGTITGATYTNGKYGKALNFNGGTDAVSVSNTISNIQTVGFWANPGTTTGISADASSTKSDTGSSPITWSHTVTSSGGNRILVVTIGQHNNTANALVTAVTYNGVSLTRLDYQQTSVGGAFNEIWYLVNPATGANTVSVSFNNPTAEFLDAVASSWTGVDQTNPFGTTSKLLQSESGGSYTLSVSGSATTDLIISSFGDGTASYTYSGNTSSVNSTSAGNGNYQAKTTGSVSSTTVNYTKSSLTTTNLISVPMHSAVAFVDINTSTPAYIHAGGSTIAATGFTSPTIYVNGVVSSTLTAGTWNYVTITTSTGLTGSAIKFGSANGTSLFGKIDGVRMYNYVRTPSQIVADMNADHPPPGSPVGTPVAYWKFDEGYGTKANNYSSAYSSSSSISFVQATATQRDASGGALTTSAITTTSGNLIIVAINWDNSNGSTFTITDTFGNTYIPATAKQTDSRHGQSMQLFYAKNISGGASHTFTATPSSNEAFLRLIVHEVSGADTSSPLDQTAVVNNEAGTAVSVGAVTTTESGEYIFAAAMNDSGANTFAADSPYNERATASAANAEMQSQDTIQTSAGSISATWTMSGTNDAMAQMATFKPALIASGNLTNMASPATSTSGWTNSGKFGKALIFDGTNDYVAMPSDVAALKITGDLTISGWINLADTSGNHDIFGKNGAAGSLGYTFYSFSGGDLLFQVSSNGTATTTVSTTSLGLTTGTWYHVAAVYKAGTSMTIYVNGVQKAQETASIPASINNTTTVANIGAENSGGTNRMQGTLDEVKVYNQALTADQIKVDMNRGQAQVLGATSDYSGYQSSAAAQEYCVPGGSDCDGTDTPVARWDFEEGSGINAFDSSGNANTGTITAGSGGYKPGKIGSSYKFDNAATVVNAGTASSLDNLPAAGMTLEAWVYPISAGEGSAGFIMAKNVGTTPSAGWILQLSSTRQITFTVDGSTDLVRTTTDTLTANSWSHVAMSWDGVITTASSVKIYINGVEAAYTTTTNGASRVDDGTSTFFIGNDSTSARTFDGRIDAVSVFNYARTAPQAKWDYNRGNPQAWYKMDECQGTTINDSSGNSRTGTQAGTTAGTCNTASTFWGGASGDSTTYSGKINYAGTFDGTNDRVTTSAFSPLAGAGTTTTKLSWGGWFNPTSFAARKTLIEKATEFRLDTDTSGNAICDIYTGGAFTSYAPTTTALTSSSWNHVMCVYNGANVLTFINGQLKNTSASQTGIITAASSVLHLGQNSSSAQRYTGRMDEVKVFNYDLTATQVKALYNDGGAVRYGPTTGPP